MGDATRFIPKTVGFANARVPCGMGVRAPRDLEAVGCARFDPTDACLHQ